MYAVLFGEALTSFCRYFPVSISIALVSNKYNYHVRFAVSPQLLKPIGTALEASHASNAICQKYSMRTSVEDLGH